MRTLFLFFAGLVQFALMMSGGILAAVHFSPPVLVALSSDAEAEQNLPVVPDRFFGIASPFVPEQEFMFGFHGGKSSFDFSSDGGSSWSSSSINVADWGDVKGIAVPMFQDNISLISPVAYHDLGSDAISSSASGWSRRNVSTLRVDKRGQLTASWDSDMIVTFSGIPSPGINSSVVQANPQRMYGMLRLDSGIYVTAIAILWNGLGANPSPDGPIIPWSLVAFSSNDTYHWEYLNVIANISDFQWSTFGATESDISFLSDKRTLICVIRCAPAFVRVCAMLLMILQLLSLIQLMLLGRMDGDANCDTGLYRYFFSALSSDGGLTWSKPIQMQGLGCVRPKLLLLNDGPLLLTGGRLCVENTKDIRLWVSVDGNAHNFSTFSLSYQHNRLWSGDSRFLFDELVNNTDAWESLAYTSLVPKSENSAFIYYNKFFSASWPPWPSATFMMQVQITRD